MADLGERNSCFSPDAEKVLVSSVDHKAEIWSLREKRRLHVLRAGTPPQRRGRTQVRCLAWSPDGRFVCIRNEGHGRLDVWNVTTGQRMWTSKEDVGRVAFSPDGARLAFVPWLSKDSPKILAAETGQVVHTFTLGKDNRGWIDLVWSADGRYVALADVFALWVWDTVGGKECFKRFSLDGRKRWPHFITPEDPCSAALDAFWGPHEAIAFLPDASALVVFYGSYADRAFAGSMLLPDPTEVDKAATMASMNRVRAYAVPSGELLWDHPVAERIEDGAISPDGLLTATAAHWGPLVIRRLGKPDVISEVELDDEHPGARSLTWTPDGRRLLARDSWVYDGRHRLRICLPFHDRPVAILGTHAQPIGTVSVSRDGRRILTTGVDMAHYVWERKFEETPWGLLGRWELWLMLAALVGLTWTGLEAGRRIARPAGPAPLPATLVAGIYVLAALGVLDLAERAVSLATDSYLIGFDWRIWDVSRRLGWPGLLVLNYLAFIMVLRLRRGWRKYMICVLALGVLAAALCVLLALPSLAAGQPQWLRRVHVELFAVPVRLPAWAVALLPFGLSLTATATVLVNLLRPSVRAMFTRRVPGG